MKSQKVNRLLPVFGFVLLVSTAFSQDVGLSAMLSQDTVLLGNYFKVEFSVENATGDFEQPDLSSFKLVGGPNTSTSMSNINGEVTRKSSYTFYLEPLEAGTVYIPEAYFVTDDTTLETTPLKITVLPNPKGIIETPKGSYYSKIFGFPATPETPQRPKKKKAKRKKI